MSTNGKPSDGAQAGLETFVSLQSGWSPGWMSAACGGRHSQYDAVISLPTHQHPACRIYHPSFHPSIHSCSFSSSFDQIHSVPSHVSSQGSWAPLWCIPVPPLWPRMASVLHLTLGNLMTKISVSPFHCSPVDFFPFSSSSSPSFSVCILFILDFLHPVKWPYQVPRYVSDAAPPVPTLRFGKEMSTKSRLQGRPSTFFPVLGYLSLIGWTPASVFALKCSFFC